MKEVEGGLKKIIKKRRREDGRIEKHGDCGSSCLQRESIWRTGLGYGGMSEEYFYGRTSWKLKARGRRESDNFYLCDCNK